MIRVNEKVKKVDVIKIISNDQLMSSNDFSCGRNDIQF